DARRDARPLPRGRGACLRRAPGLHARGLGGLGEIASVSPARAIPPNPPSPPGNYNSPPVIFDRAIVRMLPAVPKPLVHRLASRCIAGPPLEDACHVVATLNGEGKLATIDVLGEEITRAGEARAIAQAYRDVFETIERQGLDSGVSVKPTALGLKLDYGLC